MYELVSPVDLSVVLKYTGRLMMAISVVLAVPMAMAIVFMEPHTAAVYGLTAVFVACGGFILVKVLPDGELRWKESLVIAAIIFPFIALLNAFPFALSTGMSLSDSFFEAVSGITTTGLSVAPAGVGPVFLFARSWLQWVGGIGIVILVLSVLVQPGTSAFRLFSANVGENRIGPNVMATARILVKIYLIITAIAFILLLLSGMPVFDSICHALSAVSTGGFSTGSDSIASFPGFFVPIVIAAGFLMGAINFGLYTRISGGLNGMKEIISDIQFRYFIVILIIGFLLLLFTMSGSMPLADALPASAFQAASALSTAGFSTIDIGSLSDSSKAVLTMLMWIGGCAGSTAGGIKIMRLVILFSIVHLVFIRFFLPKEALTPLKAGEEVIEPGQVYHIFTYVILYVLVILVSGFVFMLNGIGPGDAFFEVSSALGTVGLSTGITGPGMPDLMKWTLVVDMVLGRIEIIPLCILLFPRTWIRR
jgi:trk system potassium uptake protein TrkH